MLKICKYEGGTSYDKGYSIHRLPEVLDLPKGGEVPAGARLRRTDARHPGGAAAWHERSGLPLKRFFNTSGLKYKELGLKDKLPAMTEEEQYALLATDGMLVKRPLIITPKGILTGFREKEWAELLS